MSNLTSAKLAAEAHTNLSMWGAVIRLMEGSLFYGATTQHRAVQQVIAIAKKEQHKFLTKYDAALDEIKDKSHD